MTADDSWRLIESGPCGAAYNMALDEAVATFVRKRGLPPTLRLYGWESPSISLGCFQRSSDVDIGYCSSNGLRIVRRPTGGRAILHGDELTYSLSSKTDEGSFSGGLLDSYKKIGSAFNLAFRKIGLAADSKRRREKGSILTGSPLCFQSSSFGEILIDNKKVVGSAQRRWEDGLLQQGSIPYLYNEEQLSNVFGIKKTAALRERTAGLKELRPELDDAGLRKAIEGAFEETFGIRFLLSQPSQEELSLARQLEQQKYLQPDWNFRR